MAGQWTSPSLQGTTSLTMAILTALQNTNRIATIVCLGLFLTTSIALSPTTLLLLWLHLTQTQPFVTCPLALSWLLCSSLQGCHHHCNTTLVCHRCLLPTSASLLPPPLAPLWAAQQSIMSNSVAIPWFEPINWPNRFPKWKASGTTYTRTN